MPLDTELYWPREALEPIFGPLKTRKTWHRLEERVSKLNQDGKRQGIRLRAAFEEGRVVLTARDADALVGFRDRLEASPGRVQRAFGALIRTKLSDGGPTLLASCLQSQRDVTVQAAREPLRLFADLAPLSGSIFIDPPFTIDGSRAKSRGAAATLAEWATAPGADAMMIVGPSGIGKSTLLGEVFRRLGPAPAASWSHPLFVPAADLAFDETGAIQWERLPGVPAGLGARLDSLFREGRLLLFLDGIDENIRLMDLSRPASWSFWGLASRNRCVITSRDRFYQVRFVCSPVERIFGAGLRVMHLPPWGPAEAKALYGAISERGRGVAKSRALIDGLAHLSKLEPHVLKEKMASFEITGLTAWNFAIYFGLHNGGKFPRNEFEILDYFVNETLRWEKAKARDSEPLPLEVIRGLLVRLGRIADGERNGRKTWRVTPEAIVEVTGRYYPFLLERKDDLFRTLRQIPFLTYEAESGSFHLEYSLGCFFAAKNIIAMALQGDITHLREEARTAMSFPTFNFLLQAFEGFDDDSRSRFAESGRRLFDEAAALYAQDRDPAHLNSMVELLEPMGYLRWPPFTAWLRDLSKQTEHPEQVNLNAARGVAYAGDAEAVDACIRRLKRDKSAREFNREYYRRMMWANMYGGRPRRDFPIEEWLRVCRWFASRLSDDFYKSLRHIHVYSFTDLLRLYGCGDLPPRALVAVAERLRKESLSWSADARAELEDFAKLAAKLDGAAARQGARA